jgi:chemotaxis signal transduction protein
MTAAVLSAERTLHILVRVGPERFAFPVSNVEEVMDAPTVEWVPVAPAGMLGQLKHRDRMLSAWDAGWAFGLERGAGAGAAIVIRDDARRIALIVDDVVDVSRLEPGGVRAVPAGADSAGVLSGVCIPADGGGVLVNVVRVESLMASLGSAR